MHSLSMYVFKKKENGTGRFSTPTFYFCLSQGLFRQQTNKQLLQLQAGFSDFV